jgi:CheY-like chemotaxis protein
MVYGFVKQSNGHITIDSEVGHGTTIKLYMPRALEGQAAKTPDDKTQEIELGTERILVVEDEALVRSVSVNILRDQGYEIVEAEDGAEAIRQLNDGQPFDLLFTDVILPGGMNGPDIAVEAERLQPGIKVIYTTGYAENAMIHDGKMDAGVTLVNKPFRRTELLDKVRTKLDGGDI